MRDTSDLETTRQLLKPTADLWTAVDIRGNKALYVVGTTNALYQERLIHMGFAPASEGKFIRIIIVDTGSTDRTKEVAARWTPHVFDFAWIHDFAATRNFSFDQATQDYILWLDADDVLLPEDSRKLSHLKQFLSPAVDAVSMQYHCDFDDQGNVTLNVRRTRLVRCSRKYQWKGAVHEDLGIKDGTFYDSDIVVTHRKNHNTSDPDRNLKIYENLLAQGREFTPQDMLHYAMELHQHRFYQKATGYYLKFMDMEDISAEDRIYGCSKLADCYYHLGDRQKEREYVFKSFEYDTPRPEVCCRLGCFFLEKNQFSQAAFWYKLATELLVPDNRPEIKVLFTEGKLDFPKGYNHGIKAASGDNILLLENGVVATHCWLNNLHDCLYSHEKIGAVGPITNRCVCNQTIPVDYKSMEKMQSFAEIHNQSNIIHGAFTTVEL